jgi:hypothetical protein
MKKILASLLIIGLFAIPVLAGPYFEVWQNPIAIDASLLFGWDFLATVADTNLNVTGDIHCANENIWVYPTPWSMGGEIGLAWNVVGRDALEFVAGTEVVLLPAAWPAYVELDTWTTTLEVIGRPSDVVTLYARAVFGFNVVNPPGPVSWIGIWGFAPRIGIRCEW